MTPTGSNGHSRGNGANGRRSSSSRSSGNGQEVWPAPPRTRSGRRRERIRLAVLAQLQRHQEALENRGAPPLPPPPPVQGRRFPDPPGLVPKPVRQRLQGDILPQVTPSMMRQLSWHVNSIKAMQRLLVYSFAAAQWFTLILWDKIWRRDTPERRAVRLRGIIERIGGTAVKLGQQMAMRIDLLPYEYTVELARMLDRMPTFPTAYAIERLESRLGKPIDECFAAFDPKPIGSASVACVFQAFLKNGDRVAIKVRRPGIGEKFVADCDALAAVLKSLEFFTVIRPGLSRNFLFEFRNMLMEELDFTKEARYTELFRSGVKAHLKNVSAPRVHFELSSEDILVTEFVGGIWMRELIAAVERNDQEALEILRQHGIYPELVAKRLLRANQYGVFENVLFHADPHPSNVVVQKNSRLVFIDFGSSGAYTTRERNNWRQLSYYHDKADIGRMVQAALAILEPLPPIDIDEFSKRVEVIFWQDLYAFKSKHAQWWERTSAKIWIRFLQLAREYNIPLNLNTLKMIRSTLLYETIAARLYPNVDAYREHRVYNRGAGKRAKKRVQADMYRLLFKGLSNEQYITVEQVLDMGNRTLYLAQRWLDTPPFQFSQLVDKAVFAVSIFIRGILRFVFSTLTLAFVLQGYRLAIHGPQSITQIDIWNACLEILQWRPYQFLVGLITFLDIRRVMFRFFDKDIHPRSES